MYSFDFLFQAFQQQGTWFWRCMKHQFKDSLFKSRYIVPFRVEINDEFLLFKRESMAYQTSLCRFCSAPRIEE